MIEDPRIERDETVIDEVPADRTVVDDNPLRREPIDDRSRWGEPQHAPGAPGPDAVEARGDIGARLSPPNAWTAGPQR